MKKVLIFSLAYYPKYIGGAEVAIKEITDRISREEIEFHMVTLRFDSTLPKIEQIGNVLVHRIGFTTRTPSMVDLKKFPLAINKFLFQVLAPFYALSLHKRYRYDALWAMMAHATGIAAGIFTMLVPHITYVLTLQEGDPPKYIERLAWPVWPLFKRAFTRADTVQVISTFLGQWATQMGYKGEPVVIPNGVNIQHFSENFSSEVITKTEEELGKESGDVFLITTSRLVHKNGIDTVIQSLALLPEEIKFIIFGIGPDEEKLKKLANTLGVSERVQFRGQALHKDIPRYLRASDIFIRPSRSEGMGNSFVEAFVAGIPVIATQEGGLSDFLFDAKKNPEKQTTGWAVAKDSTKEIRDAVMDIIQNKDVVQDVLKNARSLATRKYDWDLVASSMKSLIFKASF